MIGPALIRDADTSWELYPALDGSFRIKRTLSHTGQVSELAIGVCELQLGQPTVWWSFIEGDDNPDVRMAFGQAYEAYYVLEGGLTFHLVDAVGHAESGEASLGDSIYFAPGWRDRVENTGATIAHFLWTMAPPAD